MSKKHNQTIVEEPIILNTLKVKSPYVCPKCEENHYAYISKKRKQKGIDFGEFYYESGLFRENYYCKWYHCLTCGHEWEIRKYTDN